MTRKSITVYVVAYEKGYMYNFDIEQERRYEIRRANTLVGGETKYQIIQNLETDRD